MGNVGARVLRINLTERNIAEDEIRTEVVRSYLGGSGLGVRLLYDETSKDIEPLSSENTLIIMTGPLTGTPVPTSGRISVVARSPITKIWGESEAGGTFGVKLRKAGYDGIIISGKSEKPIYLLISDKEVILRDARHLWGKDTFETDVLVKKETSGKASTICIGPSGESQIKLSSIISDGLHGRAAGRCGLGAVMGSKNLKAIVAYGQKNPEIIHKDKLYNSLKNLYPTIREKTKSLHDYGTAGELLACEEIGDLPIKNWTLGKWEEGAKKISGHMLAKVGVQRYYCGACTIGCGRTIVNYQSPYGTISGGGPEYETLAAFGSMCLIDDLPSIIKANDFCNRYGLDTISTGSVIAFAMEAYEKEIISRSDTGGLELRWGNPISMLRLLEMIGNREGIGALLGEGVRTVADELGKNSKEFALEVKGLELPMHDPRAFNSLAVGYATSPFGASHWAASHLLDKGQTMPILGITEKFDRFETKGKGIMTAKMQDYISLFNALRMCRMMRGLAAPHIVDWINFVTGWDMDFKELMRIGERIFNLKRMYNIRLGLSRKDDTLPVRILTHKRGEGGAANYLPNLDEMLSEYYQYRTWNEEGFPLPNKLIELGLEKEIMDLPHHFSRN